MQRLKIDSKFQHEMKMKSGNTSFVGNDDDDDRISQFPDHILVDILSLLSLKEAGRTTVLSSRWINLWKNTHSLNFSFDFDAETAPPTHEYVKWVDTILQSHKSPTLKLFRIHYGLDTGSISDSITRWLEFAFSRHVQELELDFLVGFDKYCFPEELLAPRNSVQLFDSKSLKALSLKSVQMSSGTIEFLLRNCPLLEKLVLHWSGKNISKLEICGSSLVLKHLEIVTGLESLIVSAPTLTSLRVKSLKGVMLENVPMLVDVSVTREYKGVSMRHIVSVLSRCNTQLETLHLSLMRCHVVELSYFPEMPKLKKLCIEYSLFEESLIKLAYLTRASPYLQELVFKNEYGRSTAHGQITDAAASLKFRHEHVKVFKFCWYEGRPDDDALVRYILENCVALEKIIIAPSSGFWCDVAMKLSVKLYAGEVDYKVNVEDDIARQLQLPHHIELVILSESDCNSRIIISNYFSVFG